MRKRKNLKAFGATALAVATVASGLSFGANAAQADTDPAANENEVLGTLVQKHLSNSWMTFSAPVAGQKIAAPSFTTESAARAAATSWYVPAQGKSGPVRSATTGLCITAGGYRTVWVAQTCDGSSAQTFKWAQVSNEFAGSGSALQATNVADNYLSTMPSASPSYVSGEDYHGTNLTLLTEVVSDGGFESTPGYTHEMQAGETKGMSVPVRATADSTLSEGTVMLAAPTGTKFTAGQTVTKGRTSLGGVWVDYPTLDAKGSVSADGKTFTGQITAGAETGSSRYYSWGIFVTADAIPVDTTSPLRQAFVGETNLGRVFVNGTTTVTVKAKADVTQPITAKVDSVDDAAHTAQVSGTATHGAEVRVGNTIIATADADGNWSGEVSNLKVGKQDVLFAQYRKGDKVNDTTITITIEDDATEQFTAAGTFDADVAKKATISGTGVNGATMKLHGPNGAVLDTATVTDGKYSFSVTAPGAGAQTFTVSQTVAGTESKKKDVVLNYGAAVAITGPAEGKVVPGDVTVTGTGAAGSKVTLTGGAKTVTTTVLSNNTFSAAVELAPSHDVSSIKVSQQSKGALTTTAERKLTADGAQEAKPVSITGPSSGSYEPMKSTVVSGTATPYAAVQIKNQWNTVIGNTTADKNGAWSFTRVYGPSAQYDLVASQKRFDGTSSQSEKFVLTPLGSFRKLVIDNATPAKYTAGKEFTFTGTATQGATITATNQWGTKVFETRANQTTGKWSTSRTYGPTAEYNLTVVQTALDGTKDRIEDFKLSPSVVNVPMTVTSHKDGDVYRPGNHKFAGVGTPGATITAKNQWNTVMGTATVNEQGEWAFDRNVGPSAAYTITFTQTKDGKTINTVALDMAAPIVQPFQLTSPKAGDTYTPMEKTTFTGKSSSFSKIAVTTILGTKVFETETDKDGNWSYTRAYGPTNTYTLNFDETTLNGTTTRVLEKFVFAPTATDTE